MNNKYRRLHSSFYKFLQGGLAAALAVVLLAIPVASIAQETTSAIRGSIAASDGGPAAGQAF